MAITEMSIGMPPVNLFTVRRDVLRQGGLTSDGRWLGWMETTMTENKSTEKTRELTEDELNTVSGGNLANSVSSALDGIFKAASTAAQKA